VTNSNVLKVVTELFTFSLYCLLHNAFFPLYMAAFMANKVVNLYVNSCERGTTNDIYANLYFG